MKIKAGHILLIALVVAFNGCDMFEGVFKSSSTITLENNSGQEISHVEILLGKEIKKLDTNPHDPFQTQKYEVTGKSVYTVAVTFADGTEDLRWADVSNTEEVTVTVRDALSCSAGMALSMNL